MNKRKFIIILLTIFLTCELHAVTTTWSRVINGRWNNAANWTNGIPGPGDDAIINDATSRCIIRSAESYVVNSLSITLQSNLVINGTLTVTNETTINEEGRLNSKGTFTANGTIFLNDESVLKTGGNGLGKLICNADIDYQNLTGVVRNGRNTNSTDFYGDLLNIDNASNNFTRGTFNYIGNVTQTIAPGNYRNLFLDGSGQKEISSGFVTTNQSFTANGTTISLTQGNFEKQNNTAVDFGTSTMIYENNGIQAIREFGVPMYNVIIRGSGNKLLQTTMTNFEVSNDLTIESGTLVIDADTVSIEGNFINNATFSQTGGTVILYGNKPSTLSGTMNFELFNLVLTKSSNQDVTIETPVSITPLGNITLSSSNDDLNITSGSLILKADATGYSTISEIPTGAFITGNVTIEAYLNATQRSWWHLASPINATAGSDWTDDIIVTGNFTGNRNNDIVGFDLQSMYAFDETKSGTQNDSWNAFPSMDVSETMTVGKGYRVFIRDDNTNVSPKTIDHTGILNQGNITIPIDYTNNGDSDNDGWNLIGNPYPATLDWGQVDKSNLAFPDAYVWNANAKSYTKFGPGITIAPFQAFFVKSNSSGTDLLVTEAMKTTSTSLQKTGIQTNVINVTIEESADDNPFHFASTQIIIDPLSTTKLDFDFDAGYLSRNLFKEFNKETLVDIGSVAIDGNKLKRNTIPLTIEPQTIPLYVEFSDLNEFDLHISLEEYEYEKNIYLKDKFLKTITSLTNNDEIKYHITTNNDPLSKSSDRLSIHIGEKPSSNSITKRSTFFIFPNPTKDYINYHLENLTENVSISLVDALGNTLRTKSIEFQTNEVTGTMPLNNIKSGIYYLTIKTGDKVESKKIRVE